ncbi:MAG TPA: hypothetical protein VFE53_08255 [Mucilaginibacter sp.]|jgi:hypothetical protein|nr:hypothetical protein [Mucilaginibacter sp.]
MSSLSADAAMIGSAVNYANRFPIEKIKQKLDTNDKNMEIVFPYLDRLSKKVFAPAQEPRKRIGYKPDEF